MQLVLQKIWKILLSTSERPLLNYGACSSNHNSPLSLWLIDWTVSLSWWKLCRNFNSTVRTNLGKSPKHNGMKLFLKEHSRFYAFFAFLMKHFILISKNSTSYITSKHYAPVHPSLLKTLKIPFLETELLHKNRGDEIFFDEVVYFLFSPSLLHFLLLCRRLNLRKMSIVTRNVIWKENVETVVTGMRPSKLAADCSDSIYWRKI